jgi:hypothetical protein
VGFKIAGSKQKTYEIMRMERFATLDKAKPYVLTIRARTRQLASQDSISLIGTWTTDFAFGDRTAYMTVIAV